MLGAHSLGHDLEQAVQAVQEVQAVWFALATGTFRWSVDMNFHSFSFRRAAGNRLRRWLVLATKMRQFPKFRHWRCFDAHLGLRQLRQLPQLPKFRHWRCFDAHLGSRQSLAAEFIEGNKG